MNRTVISLIVIIAGVAFCVYRIVSHPMYDKRVLADISYNLKCTECGAGSTYTTKELEKFVSKGKIVEVPMQVRRFPCSKCGKIAALSYPGVTDASQAPK